MGVAGSGKSTVGRRLAAALGWDFVDADDLHSTANVAKMAAGTPLDDADRAGWLAAVASVIGARLAGGRPAVIACSALRRSYRERLGEGHPGVAFAYLKGGEALLRRRLEARHGHFAHADLLASQLATLEEPVPDEGIPAIGTDQDPDEIVADVRRALAV
jgi:gluconokinase